jgi:D-alanine-D-alanine ligase
MAFYLWEPTGIKYPALIDELVTIALRAKADKKKNSYAYDSSILDKVKAGRGVKGAKGSKHG